MNSNENTLNWFEISVNDISRAKKFYEAVFDIKMETSSMGGMDMAFFPMEMGNGKAGGSLCKSDKHKPSADGVKIYLNGNPDLSTALSKVEVSGGKIIMPKTKISDDIGYMASFADTEGNTIAIHSQH